MVAYWPKSDDQPFADFINNVHKYVATASPLTNEWTKAEPIQGPVDHFVRELIAGEGGDIGIHGSISLAQYLLAQGLVDELRLLVAPRVVGSGRRLFEDDVAYSLELVRSTGSPSGSLLIHYNVIASKSGPAHSAGAMGGWRQVRVMQSRRINALMRRQMPTGWVRACVCVPALPWGAWESRGRCGD